MMTIKDPKTINRETKKIIRDGMIALLNKITKDDKKQMAIEVSTPPEEDIIESVKQNCRVMKQGDCIYITLIIEPFYFREGR